jgi:hypothetical protein
LRPSLVFRKANQQAGDNRNEISYLDSDLVLREIPGYAPQLRGHRQRRRAARSPFCPPPYRTALRGARRQRPQTQPPVDEVVRIALTPPALSLLTAPLLALRLTTGSLA